jgi:hypothetical protein
LARARYPGYDGERKESGGRMATIRKYTIVNGKSDTDLIDTVNKLIKQEWRPSGGPFPGINQHGKPVLFQAMVHSEWNPS